MTDLDEAQRVIEEYRATPPASTRRRVRLAIRMMDIVDEYTGRLIDGGISIFREAINGDREVNAKKVVWWIRMWSIRDECLREIDKLGMDKTQLAIAMATTIFDAEVVSINDTQRPVDAPA